MPQERLAEFYIQPESKLDEDELMEDEEVELEEPVTDYAYTVAAAQRSEQRRLINYVKMSDYVVSSSLQTMLLESMKDILSYTCPEEPKQPEAPEDGAAEAAAEGAATEGSAAADPSGGAVPLYSVELLFVNESELLFQPSRGDFQQSIEDLVSGFVETLCTVPRCARSSASRHGDVHCPVPARHLHHMPSVHSRMRIPQCLSSSFFFCLAFRFLWALSQRSEQSLIPAGKPRRES